MACAASRQTKPVPRNAAALACTTARTEITSAPGQGAVHERSARRTAAALQDRGCGGPRSGAARRAAPASERPGVVGAQRAEPKCGAMSAAAVVVWRWVCASWHQALSTVGSDECRLQSTPDIWRGVAVVFHRQRCRPTAPAWSERRPVSNSAAVSRTGLAAAWPRREPGRSVRSGLRGARSACTVERRAPRGLDSRRT